MTSSQSPTINLDQIINSDEWTLLASSEEIIDTIYGEYDVPEDERQTICTVNELTGSILIDKVIRMTVYSRDTVVIWTLDGHHISPRADKTKVYLFTPRDPLPARTGSKIYNVTVQDLTESGDGIEYLFDTLTLDREGRWFGLDQHGELRLVDEAYEFLKITKFSLTPDKP